ncbi:hypothetical protein L210DRAFT_457935 [Boletus edulis BED1]|uniref:Uncharacterized protein n=1 Tax=Boletus edulis BED1 TaxID=1328754 RepID=A0AAD4BIH5_BOLED|nr:hypothetical protein L210DRAFT_457935 [Boletus edulis BED1]
MTGTLPKRCSRTRPICGSLIRLLLWVPTLSLRLPTLIRAICMPPPSTLSTMTGRRAAGSRNKSWTRNSARPGLCPRYIYSLHVFHTHILSLGTHLYQYPTHAYLSSLDHAARFTLQTIHIFITFTLGYVIVMSYLSITGACIISVYHIVANFFKFLL